MIMLDNHPRIRTFFFIFLTVCLLLAALITSKDYYDLYRNGVKIKAYITGHDNSIKMPYTRYEYDWYGLTYYGSSSFLSGTNIGDSIEIVVNPNNLNIREIKKVLIGY